MRIFYLLLIICCVLFSVCNCTDTTFPREETLTQELMPIQGATFPVRIEVKHPFLIFQNIKRNDSLFHVYNLTNHEFINAFGTTGQGPDEFISPWLFQTQLSDILIDDKKMVYRFNLNEEGAAIRKAVAESINKGIVTEDIAESGKHYKCSEVGTETAKFITNNN